MDLVDYGEMVLELVLDMAPVIVAWFLMRQKHAADTARKWQEVADGATDEVVELRAENDTLRAERDDARARLARCRCGEATSNSAPTHT